MPTASKMFPFRTPALSGLFVVVSAAAASLLSARPACAQLPRSETDVVERIAAVVGDSVILMTEVDQQLFTLEARGWRRPTEPAALAKVKLDVLDLLVNQQLILQDALRDTLLIISDDELEERVQEQIDAQVAQFGTLARLQQALAEQDMTMAVYREQQKSLIQRQLTQERYLAKQGRDRTDVVVTEAELREWFAENEAQMPLRPPTIRFQNLQLRPQATDSAKKVATDEAIRIRNMIVVDEEDFADIASRFSDGPSRAVGGLLDWIRRDGSFVKEFEDVAFGLPPGIVSLPVESQFGFHLILVERVRGGERRVRHILIEPEIEADDIDDNLVRANELRTRLVAGEEMAEITDLAIDTLEMTQSQLGQISEFYQRALPEAKVGDVLGPLRVNDPTNPNVLGLVKILEINEGGPAGFEDVRDQIEARLEDELKTQRVVEGLRSKAYIDLRLGGG